MSEKLNTDWTALASTQEVGNFIKDSMTKKLAQTTGGPDMLAYFNPRLGINRFFIEDSDGKKGPGEEMPKIESAASNTDGPTMGFNDNSDPFEDDLEDALYVFKPGDGNTDILEKNEKLIMFYLDLENEMIVDKSTAPEEVKTDEMSGPDAMEVKHPVLINQFPTSPLHSLVLLFADAGLPQVLSDEILLLVLQVFKVSEAPGLRVGYNSIGAESTANNLHFHLVFANQMFGALKDETGNTEEEEGPGFQFPIELAGKKLFFRSTLKHKNEDEINMYSCPVRFG